MGDTNALGFGHFLVNADIVAKVLLVVLALMSAISWYLIVYKGISVLIRQRRSAKFLTFFWSATSLEAVQNELNVHGVHEPFGHLTAHSLHAQAHHEKFGAGKLEEAGSEQEFLTRTIKKVLDALLGLITRLSEHRCPLLPRRGARVHHDGHRNSRPRYVR